jgi:hypothetical protein
MVVFAVNERTPDVLMTSTLSWTPSIARAKLGCRWYVSRSIL